MEIIIIVYFYTPHLPDDKDGITGHSLHQIKVEIKIREVTLKTSPLLENMKPSVCASHLDDLYSYNIFQHVKLAIILPSAQNRVPFYLLPALRLIGIWQKFYPRLAYSCSKYNPVLLASTRIPSGLPWDL